MRAQLLKVATGPDMSFSVRHDLVPHINNRWHYHSEVELVHFKKGEGTQFIGDSIRCFKDGDVILVGSHLPHYWRFDNAFFDEDATVLPDVRVTHFHEHFWGEQFLRLPENIPIKLLLEKAKRGLAVTGAGKEAVAAILEQLLHAEGAQKIILLIEALWVISGCRDVETLSSIGFQPERFEPENDRINAVYDYSMKHFKRKIQLEEIADVANISPKCFCRYFKSRTRKTYSRFLMELRVGHACRLLIQNSHCLKKLCYESGFNNITSFHKYFKIITGKSPLAYQREFIQ